jgi:hypothetical protein
MKNPGVATLVCSMVLMISSCSADSITDFKNPVLESFWASPSLGDERLQPYMVNDVLVSLHLPHADYKYHDAGVTFVASSSTPVCRVLRLQIDGIGEIPLSPAGEPRPFSKMGGGSLHRSDRIVATAIDAASLQGAATASHGKLQASLLVSVENGGHTLEKEISIPFETVTRRYAPLR